MLDLFINVSKASSLSNIADKELYETFVNAGEQIAEHFENLEYSHAIREIMALADKANQYIDSNAPWVLAKDTDKEQELHEVTSMGLNLFRVLMTYLKPVLPELTKRCEAFMNQEFTWDNRTQALTNHTINPFKALMGRIDPKKVAAMMTTPEPEQPKQASISESDIEPIAETIDFDTFAKVDLRVAKVIEAKAVPEAKN